MAVKNFIDHKGTSAMKKYPRKKKMSKEAAFHEVNANEPKIVAHTRAKFGAADAKRQKIAIALSKAGLSKRG